MAEFIDLRELYTSIAGSMDEANRHMEEAAKDGDFSYAITDLEFAIPFNELTIKDKRVSISLARAGDQMSEARNLRFKVRFVPRVAVPEAEKEVPDQPGAMVPDVFNKTLHEAEAEIKAWGLEVGSIRYDPTKEPTGQVVSQMPLPLTRADIGAKVDLVIAGEAPKPKPRKKAPPKEAEPEP
jgi:hypothetical protein